MRYGDSFRNATQTCGVDEGTSGLAAIDIAVGSSLKRERSPGGARSPAGDAADDDEPLFGGGDH